MININYKSILNSRKIVILVILFVIISIAFYNMNIDLMSTEHKAMSMMGVPVIATIACIIQSVYEYIKYQRYRDKDAKKFYILVRALVIFFSLATMYSLINMFNNYIEITPEYLVIKVTVVVQFGMLLVFSCVYMNYLGYKIIPIKENNEK